MHSTLAAALALAAQLLQPLTVPAPVLLEAEYAVISQGAIESNHPGYTGSGFVNYDNLAGSYVEWAYDAAEAGPVALTLRYANGTTANRRMDVAGTLVDFPGTGSWTTWRTARLTVELPAGVNLIGAPAPSPRTADRTSTPSPSAYPGRPTGRARSSSPPWPATPRRASAAGATRAACTCGATTSSGSAPATPGCCSTSRRGPTGSSTPPAASPSRSAFTRTEPARQMEVYYSHLRRSNGLLYHAYDEPGSPTASWVKPSLGDTNGISWCRAIGWFGMAAVEVLEVLPTDHPRRQALVDMIRRLVPAYAQWQDPATGRWWQVVTNPGASGNSQETSCSAMYTYTISRAVERGYVDASYRANAERGYQGVLAKVSVGADGRTDTADISEGTNVDDVVGYYYGRARPVNDFHGLGAFLIMNEQMMRVGAAR
jgi:hypothetical protein